MSLHRYGPIDRSQKNDLAQGVSSGSVSADNHDGATSIIARAPPLSASYSDIVM